MGRRTSAPVLITLAVIAAGLGWLAEVALTASGRPSIIPPTSLTIALLGIAAVVISFGWPIRQTVRGKRVRPLDPFFAMRVLVLARACSLMGALLFGAGLGILLYGVTRSVMPGSSAVISTVSELVGSVVLLGAGLLVEHWCRVPPSDDTEPQPLRGAVRND